MKKLFLSSVMMLALVSCNQTAKEKGAYQVNVSIQGNNIELASDTVILTNNSKKELIADTIVLKNNKALFKGVTTTPDFFYVMIKTKHDGVYKNACRFFLEEGTTNVVLTFDGDVFDASVKGGELQTVMDSLNANQEKLFKSVGLDTLMDKLKTATELERAAIVNLYDSVRFIVQTEREKYIDEHPLSMYSFMYFISSVNNMAFEEAKEMLVKFKASEKYASNKNLAEAEMNLNAIEALQPGNIAPDFVQNDPQGNPVKFSDIYKNNKVTMVDFWASWCGPCRNFNPKLVKIYQQYHKKGFEILAVSLDRDKESWEKAIKDDKLTWHHVSDLGFWDNAVAREYRINSIPQNLFVDQDGKIIGRRVSEEKIAELLDEYLK